MSRASRPRQPRAALVALALLAIPVALAACAQAPSQAPSQATRALDPAEPRVELTARTRDGLPASLVGPYFYIETQADGVSLTLILDTGAEQTVIDAAAADRLFPDRTEPTTIRAVSADGLRADIAGVVRLGSLTAGPVRATGVTALAVGMSPILDELHRQTGLRAHGLLGWDVLGAVTIELDYPAAAVRVESSGALASAQGQALVSGPLPTVDIDMPDGRRRFTIDTGAAGSLQMPVIRRLPLRGPPQRLGDAQSITGVTPAVGARMNGSIRFGGATITDPMVERTSGPARIGAGLLRSGVITIDPAARRVRFRLTAD